MGFQRASELAPNGTVYASDNIREALELCGVQNNMIQEMKDELDRLKEDIEDD